MHTTKVYTLFEVLEITLVIAILVLIVSLLLGKGVSREKRATNRPAAQQVIPVISFSGGGTLGLNSAIIAESLVKAAGGMPIHEQFRMGAGTSIGGIIVTMSAMEPITCVSSSDITALLKTRSIEIFGDPLVKTPQDAATHSSRFSPKPLEQILRGVVGDLKYNRASMPVLLMAHQTYPERQISFLRSGDAEAGQLQAVDVMMASSAALGTFPAHNIKLPGGRSAQFVDGCFVENNPALELYLEARQRFPDAKLLLVDVGVGRRTIPVDCDKLNLLEVGVVSGNLFCDGNNDAVPKQLQRIAATVDRNLEYICLDPPLPENDPGLTDNGSPAYLQALEDNCKRYLNSPDARHKIKRVTFVTTSAVSGH